MAEENIVLFGYNAEAGWIDAAETQVLAQCQMMTYPLAQIRGTVKESAKEALTQLESKADSILIYFDVGEPGCRCQPVLSFDYERLPESSETMVKIASFRILIRRL